MKTAVTLLARACVLACSIVVAQPTPGGDQGSLAGNATNGGPSVGQERFVLIAGRLNPTVLPYAAGLATNAVFVNSSNQIARLSEIQAFAGEAAHAIRRLVAYFNDNALPVEHGTKGS